MNMSAMMEVQYILMKMRKQESIPTEADEDILSQTKERATVVIQIL